MNYFSLNNAYIMIATIAELEIDFNCLIAKDKPNTNIGSMACRKLLFNLQKRLNLTNNYQPIVLNENQFPYYFIANEKKYWVSFSHSQNHVAVMVVPDSDIATDTDTDTTGKKSPPRFGIDIEDKRISDAVAGRFFCQAELAWLASLDNSQKLSAKKLLWTFKESLIKAEIKGTLVAGLKNNLLNVLDSTQLADLLQANQIAFNVVKVENQLFGFSPELNCGFVMLG